MPGLNETACAKKISYDRKNLYLVWLGEAQSTHK